MGHKITLDDKRRLLTVKYHGEISLDDRIQAVAAGTAKLESSGYRIVLVDMSNAEMKEHTPEEKSDFASLLSDNETLKKCHVAYLTRENQHSNDFIEILARARHFNFEHFTDVAAANQWLSRHIKG